MRGNRSLWRLLWDWSRIVDRAARIKADPERRRRSFGLGVWAICYGAVAVACAFALLLFPVAFDHGIFLGIFAIAIAVALGVVGTATSLITAFVYWFCQLSVNRRPFTWISLAVLLAILGAGAAVVTMMLLG